MSTETDAETDAESSADSTVAASVARCVVAVAAYFGAVFASIEGIGEVVLGALGTTGRLAAGHLAELVEPTTTAALAAHPVVGAGFVAAPGWLTDRDLFLAWWQGEDRRPLAERGVPIGNHVFDYTRHEWFQTPLTTGRRHVAGPYVDYVCTDEYVLTATSPVLHEGRMIGLVGADTLLETFEHLMRGTFDAGAAAGVVLVNAQDRCVVAADPLLRSGQRIDAAAYRHVVAVEGLPFRVLGDPA